MTLSAKNETDEVCRAEREAPTWRVEVFHDGDCPLCRREISFLRRRDRRGQIRFTDIAAPDFEARHYGRSLGDFQSEIHGRLPDGTWIRGVEVFRQLYSAIGLGLLVAPTRLPGLSHALEWSYRLFARNRLRLTGRCGSQGEGCSTRPPTRVEVSESGANGAVEHIDPQLDRQTNRAGC